MPNMTTCLWFNHEAEEAAKFYTSLFPQSKIQQTAHYSEAGAKASGQPEGSILTVSFEIAGHRVMGLNGGPHFKHTPALSFFVWCDTTEEIHKYWQALSTQGEVRMGLDKYPWAEQYGWTKDRFGVEWQFMLSSNPNKIMPALLFVDELFGRGKEALDFYLTHFKNAKVNFLANEEKTNTIAHCQFTLNGAPFVLMEGQGKHGYSFSLAFSFMVHCDTQGDIDQYWSALSDGGSTSQCGWLTDKFGIAWQIIPSRFSEWMKEPKAAAKVMEALLKMTKLNIAELQKAYEAAQ